MRLLRFADPISLADPFILLHNDVYYAYGTNSEYGIDVYTSDNLKEWEKAPELALHKDNSYGDRWFWVPGVCHVNDRFNDGLNIWVAELEEDLMTLKTETLHPCIHVSRAPR